VFARRRGRRAFSLAAVCSRRRVPDTRIGLFPAAAISDPRVVVGQGLAATERAPQPFGGTISHWGEGGSPIVAHRVYVSDAARLVHGAPPKEAPGGRAVRVRPTIGQRRGSSTRAARARASCTARARAARAAADLLAGVTNASRGGITPQPAVDIPTPIANDTRQPARLDLLMLSGTTARHRVAGSELVSNGVIRLGPSSWQLRGRSCAQPLSQRCAEIVSEACVNVCRTLRGGQNSARSC
jgi:hypothetical protein